MLDPNGNQQACLWEAGGPPKLLGTLGGNSSQATAINNRGQVVANSDLPGGSRHAFLWDATLGMQDLGTLGGTESYAHAINDAGRVVGLSHTPTQRYQPFIWDPNEGMLAVASAIVHTGIFGINNSSCVAGQTASAVRGRRLVLWRKGAALKALCMLGGSMAGGALLNDANQVVFNESPAGRSSWIQRIRWKFFPPRASWYLWDPDHGRISLDPYIPARRKEVFLAMDINNKGCIVGILASGPRYSHSRAILLEPIPGRWDRRGTFQR